VEAAIEHVCLRCGEGAVLVFLTGWDDIKNLAAQLKQHRELRDESRYLILPLHGSMPTVEQKVIFQRPKAGAKTVLLVQF
jgi:ATP-dependent RNA helicase DHX36